MPRGKGKKKKKKRAAPGAKGFAVERRRDPKTGKMTMVSRTARTLPKLKKKKFKKFKRIEPIKLSPEAEKRIRRAGSVGLTAIQKTKEQAREQERRRRRKRWGVRKLKKRKS